jgi:c-di-GMP-related signal transduction protein
MNTTSAKPASERPPLPAQQLRYVARQPICDRETRVFGYELLFRNGVENAFSGGDLDMASRATLDRSVLVGIDMLCDGRRAFVNCTRDTLIKGLVTLLPPTATVVEILEGVPADPDVMTAVQRLKEMGYFIALDDFVTDEAREPLVELADIIKVDVKVTTLEQRAAMVKRYGPLKRRMLAEKVETLEEFNAAKDQEFVYFQGYFFRKPEMVSTHEMPANRLHYLRMLQAVSSPDLDMAGLEELIRAETSICYRLLRYLNSSMFGFRTEIHSVKQALRILGEREMRRWVRLVAAVGAGQDSSCDLLLSSLVRARFAELLTPNVPHGESDLFLMGLLSLIDAMLEMPMEKVLEMIPLDKETKAVLMGQPSLLRPVHQLMLAHESGEWEAAASVAGSLNLDKEETASRYLEAQQWARDISAGV